MVEGPTPLLLSAKFLLEHRVSVDFSSGKAWFPAGGTKPLQLERSPNYHLLLPVTGFAGNMEVIRALQPEDDEEMDDDERNSCILLSGCLRSRNSSILRDSTT